MDRLKGVREPALSILLREEEGTVHLSIRDNGRGLPDDVNPSDSESIGFRIVQTFASQIRADLQYGKAGGTVIALEFAITDLRGPRDTTSLRELGEGI